MPGSTSASRTRPRGRGCRLEGLYDFPDEAIEVQPDLRVDNDQLTNAEGAILVRSTELRQKAIFVPRGVMMARMP